MTWGGRCRRDQGQSGTVPNSKESVHIVKNPIPSSSSNQSKSSPHRIETPPESRFRSYQEDSWEELDPSIDLSNKETGNGGDREVRSTEVKRTMSLQPRARRPYDTEKLRHEDEVGHLWREGKLFMEESSSAEEAGDTAVAVGKLSQAACKYLLNNK